MLNPEHSCAVFALAGDLIVLAESLSVDGAWIFNGFAERIAAAAADEDLGAAVLRGLATSTTGVAHPSDWSTFNREAEVQLQRVGVCSFAQLHRQARCVRVDRVGGSVKVTPHASGGASGPGRGFSRARSADRGRRAEVRSPSRRDGPGGTRAVSVTTSASRTWAEPRATSSLPDQ